jgi:hypothetical protein
VVAKCKIKRRKGWLDEKGNFSQILSYFTPQGNYMFLIFLFFSYLGHAVHLKFKGP